MGSVQLMQKVMNTFLFESIQEDSYKKYILKNVEVHSIN